jgi:hypothetical protein
MDTTDHHDIVVYSNDSKPVIVVTIKGGKETSPEHASTVRQCMLQQHELSEHAFFLLAYKTSLFLWQKDAPAEASPQIAPVKDILRDYGGKSADREHGPRPESLETTLYFWLDDLAAGIRTPKMTSPADQLLVQAGAYKQLRAGHVVRESLR